MDIRRKWTILLIHSKVLLVFVKTNKQLTVKSKQSILKENFKKLGNSTHQIKCDNIDFSHDGAFAYSFSVVKYVLKCSANIVLKCTL